MSRRKRILLTGNCEYELLGLSYLLAGNLVKVLSGTISSCMEAAKSFLQR